MPSPVGHALGGLVVGLALAPRAPAGRVSEGGVGHRARRLLSLPRTVSRSDFLVLCAVAACLPDIDFLWGLHSQHTHSIGFALAVGMVVFLRTRATRLSTAITLAIGTHVLFDWLGSDDFPPLGVMALWPFSGDFYFGNAYVFATISRRYWLPGFVQHNVMAVLREVAILLPPLAAVCWWRVSRTGRRATEGTQVNTEKPTL